MNAKNHLERILYIDAQIRNEGFPSKSKFAEHFGISAKTIERDFEYLRDRLEAPLEYSAERRGSYYRDPNYFLPSLVFTEDELFALSFSLETVNGLGKPELSKSLASGFGKLFKFLPDKIKTDLDILASRSFFVGSPGTEIESEVWKGIIKSVLINRKIDILYRSPGHYEFVRHKLCPYYLLANEGMWYILSYDEDNGEIRTYALHRIKKIKILSENFLLPENINVDDYIDKTWGIFSSDKIYNVEIEFSQWLASRITEKAWPDNYTIERLSTGDIILRFNTNQLEQVRFWTMSWGSGAKVLNPPELRKLVAETVKEMSEIYC